MKQITHILKRATAAAATLLAALALVLATACTDTLAEMAGEGGGAANPTPDVPYGCLLLNPGGMAAPGFGDNSTGNSANNPANNPAAAGAPAGQSGRATATDANADAGAHTRANTTDGTWEEGDRITYFILLTKAAANAAAEPFYRLRLTARYSGAAWHFITTPANADGGATPGTDANTSTTTADGYTVERWNGSGTGGDAWTDVSDLYAEGLVDDDGLLHLPYPVTEALDGGTNAISARTVMEYRSQGFDWGGKNDAQNEQWTMLCHPVRLTAEGGNMLEPAANDLWLPTRQSARQRMEAITAATTTSGGGSTGGNTDATDADQPTLYSRLHVVTTPKATVSIEVFPIRDENNVINYALLPVASAASLDGTAVNLTYTATADDDGNVYFYGFAAKWDNATLSWVPTTDVFTDPDAIVITASGMATYTHEEKIAPDGNDSDANITRTDYLLPTADKVEIFRPSATVVDGSLPYAWSLSPGLSRRLTGKVEMDRNNVVMIDAYKGITGSNDDEGKASDVINRLKGANRRQTNWIVVGDPTLGTDGSGIEIDGTHCYNLSDLVGKALGQMGGDKKISVSLPDATQIGGKGSGFSSCSQLLHIALPAVEEIDNNAFKGCTALETVDLSRCENLTMIGDYAFQNCEALTAIDLGNRTTLKAIGQNAFSYCKALKTADLSNCTALTAISREAFSGCKALKTVDLSNCTALGKIDKDAFSTCTGLETANLGNCTKLETIGEQAFNSCDKLKTVDLSNCAALKTIGNNAFFNCKTLNDLDLGQSKVLETIGTSAFYCCEALPTVDLSNCTELTKIGQNAFNYCYALKTANLSGCTELEMIDRWVFQYCSALTTLNLSNCTKLETIDYGAFEGCKALTTIDLSGSTALKEIHQSAFQNCKALTSLSCFSPCTELETIVGSAFQGCEALTDIDLSPYTKLKTVGQGAFQYCKALKTIDLSRCPALSTTISGSLFYGCTSLETVILNSELTTIEYGVFKDCTSLTSIDLSQYPKLTAISESLFQGCTALKTVILNPELTTIGNSAFSNCKALATIDLSKCTELTKIDYSAFAECTSLKTIDFSKCTGLTTIGYSAFAECTSLKTIDLSGCIITTWGSYDEFKGIPDNQATLILHKDQTYDEQRFFDEQTGALIYPTDKNFRGCIFDKIIPGNAAPAN